MKIIKYILLAIALLNVPTFSLEYVSPSLGALTSMFLLAGSLLYFFISKKSKPAFPFIILGLCFFTFAGLNYSGITDEFFKDVIRFFIFIICFNQVSKDTTDKELLIFLLIGALSITVNALFFSNVFGRYSGFYINPNKAGFICLFGFAISYIINSYKLRLVIQFAFIICGIFTLSRSFILMLVLINLASLFADKRNIQTFVVGSAAMTVILTASTLQLNKERFSALNSIFSSNEEVDTQTITEGSRDETWAMYSNVIFNNAIIGAGYKAMRGDSGLAGVEYGVHNTFLMVLGEAGILAFLLIVIIYLALFVRSLKLFSTNQEFTYLSMALIGYLMVAHNYFDKYDVLFVSLWLYNKVRDQHKEDVSQILAY
ncbi:O-antigen ligase family protein [Corallibacter sp.]|uniref:O-antigen ligase family protein n=1 Tax=Corallibacter sp. TaxID=2038084 RepID=UPI003AB8E358